MFKRIALLGLIVSSTLVPIVSPQAITEKVVAWDLDDVLIKGHCLIQSTCNLVKKLQKNGVTQVIFSNKSHKKFCKLLCIKHKWIKNEKSKRKYASQISTVKNFIEFIKAFTMLRSLVNPQGIKWRKPNDGYMRCFLNKQGNMLTQNIYFVDDKLKNCQVAERFGMKARRFCNNAHVIQGDLVHMGLL